MKTVALTLFVFALMVGVARAQKAKETFDQLGSIQSLYEHGAWVCNGGSASYADDAIIKFYREGKIRLTDSIIGQLTSDYGCRRVNSDTLTVKDFYGNELELDTSASGHDPSARALTLTQTQTGAGSEYGPI